MHLAVARAFSNLGQINEKEEEKIYFYVLT
jgi:hypothetical protein